MPTVEETITQLKEMGFSEEKAKKALMMTGWKGVEPAMEWILAHPDDDGTLDEEVCNVYNETSQAIMQSVLLLYRYVVVRILVDKVQHNSA